MGFETRAPLPHTLLRTPLRSLRESLDGKLAGIAFTRQSDPRMVALLNFGLAAALSVLALAGPFYLP